MPEDEEINMHYLGSIEFKTATVVHASCEMDPIHEQCDFETIEDINLEEIS